MKNRNRIEFIVLVLLFLVTLCAKNVLGKRPDLAPSKLMQIAGSSIEDKIIDQAVKVKEYRDKWQKFSHTETKGIWPFRYFPKKKALKKLRKEEERLKNLLASTPSGAETTKAEMFEDVDDVTNANAEALEIKLSLENLRNTMLEARKDLLASPSDLTVASTYYTAHVTCLATIIQMSEEFVQNIDMKYIPAFIELKLKFNTLIEKSDKKLSKTVDSDDAKKIGEIKANQVAVINALEKASTTLPKQKEWATDRLIQLQKRLEIASLATETVEATVEAKGLIQNFGSDYEKLTILPPPLIVFEVDLPDFKLPVVQTLK